MDQFGWVFTAWGRILAGYRPALSVEITRECPLRCPGCYAYGDEHLGGGVTPGEEAADEDLLLGVAVGATDRDAHELWGAGGGEVAAESLYEEDDA